MSNLTHSFSILFDCAQQLQNQNSPQLGLPALVFMTDRTAIPDPITIIKHFPKPVLVIIRDYDHPDRYEYTKQIAAICQTYHHPYLVANNVQLAQTIKANGVHLSEYTVKQATHIKKRYPNWVITSSVHNQQTLNAAQRYPLDLIFISPIFATQSHPHKTTLGFIKLQELARKSIIPSYALGGINNENCHLLNNSLVSGIAGIRCFHS